MSLPEVELARRAIAGDRGAFTTLVQGEAGRVYRLATNMLGDPAEAERVLRETCVEAAREVSLLPSGERFDLWFLHLAAEACLRRLDAPARPAAMTPPALRDALRGVEPHDRLAFLLRDVEALPWGEVAWMLDEAPAAARARVHRVRVALCPLVESGSSNQPLHVV